MTLAIDINPFRLHVAKDYVDQLTKNDHEGLVDVFSRSSLPEKRMLAGRGKAAFIAFENGKKGVIKQYKRGGLIRFFVKEYYLRTGKTRCENEFEVLRTLAKNGCSVPTPMLWATSGHRFYKGWLVTEEVENSVSFSDFIVSNSEDSLVMLTDVVNEVHQLIEQKLLHVDLHPGNILIKENKIIIIDFDKAIFVNYSIEKLKQHYIKRWRRAVFKYGFHHDIALIFEQQLLEKNKR